MDEEKKAQFQAELLRLRKEVTEALARKTQDVHGRAGGEALDEADMGNATLSMELELSSRRMLLETLEMIDKALRRIETGTYDTCEICRRKIPLERLQAIPYTSYCVECQAKQEAQRKK
ncbi:TraR/DksA family transcriptional regulator [Candidatus Caldatribacterium sp. SIUC1]|uniref:TraR/DksA family transcriptional regulator n=1 Tax=Candidatus Caldatribacterium sp. SIUC1 TaxID=3418365 RepID=UPI003F68BE38